MRKRNIGKTMLGLKEKQRTKVKVCKRGQKEIEKEK